MWSNKTVFTETSLTVMLGGFIFQPDGMQAHIARITQYLMHTKSTDLIAKKECTQWTSVRWSTTFGAPCCFTDPDVSNLTSIN